MSAPSLRRRALRLVRALDDMRAEVVAVADPALSEADRLDLAGRMLRWGSAEGDRFWGAQFEHVHAVRALQVAVMDRHPRRGGRIAAEPVTTPEDTLRAAGIDDARQAAYQRKMSTLLGRPS